MDLNDNQVVTLLLTTTLANSENGVKPLSLGKWNNLLNRIINSDIKELGSLLNFEKEYIKKELHLTDEDSNWIDELLKKGAGLAIKLEELNRIGIGVICRLDESYPKLIKDKLKEYSPPVLFYSGNIELLGNEGIGMVGSRNIDIDILDNTKYICEKATSEGFTIISGGAKGVDTASEMEAFNLGGSYISFVCDSLLKRIKKKDVRDRIETGRVLYLTMDGVDYPFSPGRAMNRNKFIYSLSKGVFILNSDYNKGGTWTGAIENIKKKLSIPLVLDNNSNGNIELIKQGCTSVELSPNFSINEIMKSVEMNYKIDSIQLNLFSEL